MEHYWSRFARNFDSRQSFVAGNDLIETVKTRLTHMKNLGHVLELGCGNGGYTTCIVDNADTVTATDYSREMVEQASKILCDNPKITVRQADGHDTEFPDNSFDTVFMANLIHVIDRPETVIEECRRTLAPQGQLTITSFTVERMRVVQVVAGSNPVAPIFESEGRRQRAGAGVR